MWGRLLRKKNPYSLLVEMEIGAATLENNMEYTQNINTACYPSILLLEIFPQVQTYCSRFFSL